MEDNIRLMRYPFLVFGIVAVMCAGCQSAGGPHGLNAAVAAVRVKVDTKALTFRLPDGDCFRLHLGRTLENEKSLGLAPAPRGMFHGYRDATSSYWEVCLRGGVYRAVAESSLRGGVSFGMESVGVQYVPDTGAVLISEEHGEGDHRRYILLTKKPGAECMKDPRLKWMVSYLGPKCWSENHLLTSDRLARLHNQLFLIDSGVHLLSGDRAEIGGKVMRLRDIPQSPNPFSQDFRDCCP